MTVTWAVISDPFLGNGLGNMFPWQQLSMQQGKWGVVYAVCAEELYKEENWATSQLSSAQVAVTRRGELKNLHR
jgi:hypothetical protein